MKDSQTLTSKSGNQIVLPENATQVEVIIRELQSENVLPVLEPLKTDISGTLGCIVEFLNKRAGMAEVFVGDCHLLVNRDKITLTLVTNEHDARTRGIVRGALEAHPKFKEFGINTTKSWTPTELGLFFKMNRAFFPDQGENKRLVHELMNFTATVNNSIDRSANEKGDRTDKFAQVVNSNLPSAFTLTIPLFKGSPAETLEIETFAKVDGRDVSFILLSPAANQTMEEVRDGIIDKQLEQVRERFSAIAIIEQ